MGDTSIEWTTTTGPDGRIHKGMTFNPWWGCEKISPGCKHCYAETFDKRWSESHWGPAHPYKLNSEAYWREPFKWNARAAKLGVRLKVFCASMADVFELRAPAELRVRLWKLIRSTPNLDWLLLTKRPEHFERFLPWMPCPTDVCKYASLSGVTCPGDDNGAHCDIEDGVGREDDGPLTCSEYRLGGETTVLGLAETSRPWPNVWLGVTAEDQKHADLRVPVLLRTPAAVRFVSYEPALEQVDFSRWLHVADEFGGRSLRGSDAGGVGDRLRGEGVAYRGTPMGSLECNNQVDPVQETARGGRHGGIPASSGDVRQSEIRGDGASSGMAPRPRSNTGRLDREPQGREQEAKLAVQPRTRDVRGTGHSLAESAQTRSTQPDGRGQRDGEVDDASGKGDASAARRRQNLDPSIGDRLRRGVPDGMGCHHAPPMGLSWIICGAESGQKARPFDEDWARKVRDDCAAAHVPLFYKQKVVGGLKIGRPMLDGRQYVEQPR